MATEIKSLCMVLVIAATFGLTVVDGELKVPCYFIFGDSLFDIGNNNMLDTKAKVNYPPYGIDFPEGPTGRFSNGRNMADFMGEFLGFEKYIPSFSTAKNKDVLLGVNYASGGSGIRGESGKHLGDRISMDKQLTNHIITVSKIILSLGLRKAKDHLSKCIYTVNMGSNDYINNYFLPSFYPATNQKYTTQQYAEVLIQQYSRQLKKLHFYGARKVGVLGLGELGCSPFELDLYGTNGTTCVENIQSAVKLFNNKLINLIKYLNNKLSDANFIFASQISNEDPSLAGFTVMNKSCCVASGQSAKGQCLPNLSPCSARDKYIYWDEFHPTELGMMLQTYKAFTALSPLYSGSTDILIKDHQDISSDSIKTI